MRRCGRCWSDRVPEDDIEAVLWFLRAAAQQEAYAQYKLGFMYDTGEGVPEDDTEAVRWYRLSAEQGHARGQYNLGRMYGKGEGVPEDNVYEYMWYNLAAAQGLEVARKSKERFTAFMTREQIAEAQKLSREWLEQHR